MATDEDTPARDGRDKRPSGRPRVYERPRRRTSVMLSEDVLDALRLVAPNASAYIERVLRERPEIAERLTRGDGQSEEHDDDAE